MLGQPLFAEQPDVLGAGQRRVLAGPQERPVFLLADRVDGLRHLAHDVKAVEHDALVAIRQPGACRVDVRLPHVHRHRLQAIPSRLGERAVVGGQALGLASFGHKFHRRTFEVTDDRVIPMPLAEGLFTAE